MSSEEKDDEVDDRQYEDGEEDGLSNDCPMEHEIDAEKIKTMAASLEDPFVNVLSINT